jgi:hypothetical protein
MEKNALSSPTDFPIRMLLFMVFPAEDLALK